MAKPTFTVKIKNVFKMTMAVKKLLQDGARDRKALNEIGKFSVERILSFVRGGRTLAYGGRPRKIKNVSESYAQMREGIVKFRTMKDGRVVSFPEPDEKLNEVDPEFFLNVSGRRGSNLTFSGQMLKALKYLIGPRSVFLFVDASRRIGKYEKLSNAEVAEYVSENGRPFVGLDDGGVSRCKKIVVNILRDLIRARNFSK